jgi:hypothetical protein
VSGFAGIVRIGPVAECVEADRSAIEIMARAIAFRGPDSLQQTHLPGASFAFSLLKTGPAPQECNQPCTLDGETWFLLEGEDGTWISFALYGPTVVAISFTNPSGTLGHGQVLDPAFANWDLARLRSSQAEDSRAARYLAPPCFFRKVGSWLYRSTSCAASIAGRLAPASLLFSPAKLEPGKFMQST